MKHLFIFYSFLLIFVHSFTYRHIPRKITNLYSVETANKILIDTSNQNCKLTALQSGKFTVIHPVNPIELTIDYHDRFLCNKTHVIDILEIGIERILNLGGRCSQIRICSTSNLNIADVFEDIGFTDVMGDNSLHTDLSINTNKLMSHCLKRISMTNDPSTLALLYNILGRISHEQEHFDSALLNYTMSLQQQPSATVFRNLGSVYHSKREYSLAFASFQQAIELDNQDSTVYLKLAYVYEDLALSDWLEAASNARKCYDYYLNSVNNEDLAALIKYGNFLVREHETEDAIRIYNNALKIDNNAPSVWFNKAFAEIKLSKYEEGKQSLLRVTKLDPNNLAALHMLNALDESNKIISMNENYVKKLFANYASDYDEHFRKMKYAVPRILRQEISKIYGFEKAENHQINLNTCAEHAKNECDDHIPQYNATLRVLDLGCGTGQIGSFLKDFSKKIVGIDLSTEMIEICRKKNVYSTLHTCSLNEFLNNEKNTENFDLVTAGELFSYIGDLSHVFQKIGKFLIPGSHFAFTVEEISSELCKGDLMECEYKLMKSGRFGYSHNYLENKVIDKGYFSVVVSKQIATRYEKGESVSGLLYILRKN